VVLLCSAIFHSCQLWDLRSDALLQHYGSSGAAAITGASWHPSGNFLLTSSLDTTVKVGRRASVHVFA
jgi:centriolar protein POC1